jgi:hypothetical protein
MGVVQTGAPPPTHFLNGQHHRRPHLERDVGTCASYQPWRKASQYTLKTKDEVHAAYQAFASWVCTQHGVTYLTALALEAGIGVNQGMFLSVIHKLCI